MLSMPRGTDPLSVLRSAREFAQAEQAYRQASHFGKKPQPGLAQLLRTPSSTASR